MLPNHAPLAVAEQFGMLEAMHPGRIDLGIGRAPGTDPAHRPRPAPHRTAPSPRTSSRRSWSSCSATSAARFPEGHPYRHVTAVTALGYSPALWLLGSSDYSAHVAGVLGLPFSFAHHFASGGTDAAVAAYRASFRPSEDLAEPYVMLGVSVVCAATDEHARWLAGSGQLAFVRLRSGRPGRLPVTRGGRRARVQRARARDRPVVDVVARRRRSRTGARAAARAGRAHGRRRADDHDHGPPPRRARSAPTSWSPRSWQLAAA